MHVAGAATVLLPPALLVCLPFRYVTSTLNGVCASYGSESVDHFERRVVLVALGKKCLSLKSRLGLEFRGTLSEISIRRSRFSASILASPHKAR